MKTNLLSLLASTIALVSASAAALSREDWPQWRGPNLDGSSPSTGLPSTLGTENLAWSAPLPGKAGSTPVVCGDRVFLTTPDEQKNLVLLCLNRKTGKELWKFQTGSGVVGCPITWEQDGEQYVAVLSGWGGAVPLWGGEVAKTIKHLTQGGSLWVFKLPKRS